MEYAMVKVELAFGSKFTPGLSVTEYVPLTEVVSIKPQSEPLTVHFPSPFSKLSEKGKENVTVSFSLISTSSIYQPSPTYPSPSPRSRNRILTGDVLYALKSI